MRVGEVHIAPGYDGVYGKIQVFSDEDRAILSRQDALFHLPAKVEQTIPAAEKNAERTTTSAQPPAHNPSPLSTSGLDPDPTGSRRNRHRPHNRHRRPRVPGKPACSRIASSI